jgi:hypothetical protein
MQIVESYTRIVWFVICMQLGYSIVFDSIRLNHSRLIYCYYYKTGFFYEKGDLHAHMHSAQVTAALTDDIS